MEDAQQRHCAVRGLSAAMAVPFVLASVNYLLGSSPIPMTPPPVRGALAFDQYLVDMGRAEATQEVRAHFDFTNRGRNPLEIVALEPSCGCLQPRLQKLAKRLDAPQPKMGPKPPAETQEAVADQRVYEPGESGFFAVRVQTANQKPGLKEYTVKVKYKDPEPRETQVTFRVVLPEIQVLVRPIALSFYQIGESAQPTPPQVFEITDYRPDHLTVQKVECTHPDMTIREISVGVEDDGLWHARYEIAAPDRLPPGETHGLVRLYVDDPAKKYKALRLPVRLVGPHGRSSHSGDIQQTGGTKSMQLRPLSKKKSANDR